MNSDQWWSSLKAMDDTLKKNYLFPGFYRITVTTKSGKVFKNVNWQYTGITGDYQPGIKETFTILVLYKTGKVGKLLVYLALDQVESISPFIPLRVRLSHPKA